MSINYYEKYMKYKTKYFNLVGNNNKIQHGGTITLDSILSKYKKSKSSNGNELARQTEDIQNLENTRAFINTERDNLTIKINKINSDIQSQKFDQETNNTFITDRDSKKIELGVLNKEIKFIDSILPNLQRMRDTLKTQIDAALAKKK
jgi:seryl-tRNA synthetase